MFTVQYTSAFIRLLTPYRIFFDATWEILVYFFKALLKIFLPHASWDFKEHFK